MDGLKMDPGAALNREANLAKLSPTALQEKLAEAHRRGAMDALKKMSEWALDCMEGEGPEAFEAYENAHVTAENLGKYYAEIKGKGD